MPDRARMARLTRDLLFVTFSARRPLEPWIGRHLLSRLGERTLAPGETLWTIGDLPDFVYFMRDGKLRFSREGAPDYARHGRWVLGLHEAVAGSPRHRTAVAETEIQALTLPAEAWVEILEDEADLARGMAVLAARIATTLHEQLAPDGGFAEPSAVCTMPAGSLNLVERLLFLYGLPFLGRAGVQALTDLAHAGEEVTFKPGEMLYERGEPRTRLIGVVSGLVEAGRKEPDVTARFGPGTVVGGATAFGDTTLSWEARAVEPTRALTLPVEVWRDEMDDHFDLFRSTVAAMVDQREQLLDILAARTPDLVLR